MFYINSLEVYIQFKFLNVKRNNIFKIAMVKSVNIKQVRSNIYLKQHIFRRIRYFPIKTEDGMYLRRNDMLF